MQNRKSVFSDASAPEVPAIIEAPKLDAPAQANAEADALVMEDRQSVFADASAPEAPAIIEVPKLDAPAQTNAEADLLEQLRLMQSKFLFMYGDHQSGKSAICASLIYHLMTSPELGTFTDRLQQNAGGQEFVRRAIEQVSKKRFLPRTNVDSVTLAGGRFVPENPNFPSIPLTFMEMAGEDLRHLVAPTGTQLFPKHIDVFLNDQSLDLVFVMVVRHDMATTQKDLMLTDFLQYIRSKDRRFEGARVLLLVSQWDGYRGDLDIHGFAKTYLPLTYSALANSKNAITTYSVGDVKTVDGMPYIATLDNESPRKTIRWIYEAVTGQDFLKPTMWQRFLGLVR